MLPPVTHFIIIPIFPTNLYLNFLVCKISQKPTSSLTFPPTFSPTSSSAPVPPVPPVSDGLPFVTTPSGRYTLNVLCRNGCLDEVPLHINQQ